MTTDQVKVKIGGTRVGGFWPSLVSIEAGQSVCWVNEEDIEHTVTSDTGSFDSGPIAPGGEWSHTFDVRSSGNYTYHCEFHRHMTGTVVVV